MRIFELNEMSLHPWSEGLGDAEYYENQDLAIEARRKATVSKDPDVYVEIRVYDGISEAEARETGLLGSEVDWEEIKTIDTGKSYYICFDMPGDVLDPIQTLSENFGKCKAAIYRLAKKLGRLPTPRELLDQKVGRPRKY